MSDFGEPWRFSLEAGAYDLAADDGTVVAVLNKGPSYTQERRLALRAAACVNALAGIADPSSQVARWKAMDVLLRRGAKMDAPRQAEAIRRALDMMGAEQIAALAAEWTPDA